MKARSMMLAVTVLALVATVIGVPAALAEETKCRTALGAVTVDNLKVPKGATCTLNGTKVKGTVKVGRDATLIATNIKVIGNVQAENHKQVTIAGLSTKVGGSVQIVQGGGASISGAKVKGDVQFFANEDPILITGNRINGNLQCKENDDLPTGGSNVVQGNAEDQCENLG